VYVLRSAHSPTTPDSLTHTHTHIHTHIQFIWHGKNYLEKMWNDLNFLNNNQLLQLAFPDFNANYNPFLLTMESYSKVLDQVNKQKGDGLAFLKGRMEQVRDAMAAGTIQKKKYTGYELKALPFSETWSGNVNIEKAKLAYYKKLEQEKLDFLRGRVTDPAVVQQVTLKMNAVINEENAREIKAGRKPKHIPIAINSKGLPYTPWSELSSTSAVGEGTIGRVFPPPALETTRTGSIKGTIGATGTRTGTGTGASTGNHSVTFGDSANTTGAASIALDSAGPATTTRIGTGTGTITGAYTNTATMGSIGSDRDSTSCIEWLEEDPLDYVSQQRLYRGVFVLGQSTLLTKKNIPEAARTDDMKKSILESKGLKRSATDAAKSTSTVEQVVNKATKKGSAQGHTVDQGDDRYKTVDTEVSYYTSGAQFAMPQMRVPNLGREEEDIWVNYQLGEWQGVSRGPNIKSFEFNEANLLAGQLKNKQRDALSKAIKRAIDISFSNVCETDVVRIKNLMRDAVIMKGSVLQLDVIQAESFLKWHKKCLASNLLMQSMYRGNTARKRCRKLRNALRAARRKVAETKKQSIEMSRKIIPICITKAIGIATKALMSVKFKFSLNMSGLHTVVKVTTHARKLKKSNILCSSCNIVCGTGKNARKSYDDVTGKNRRNPNTVIVNRLAPQTFYSNDSIVYQSTAGPHIERSICVCQWVHSPEQWCLSVYEPLTRRTLYVIKDMIAIRELIRGVCFAQTLMDPITRAAKLVPDAYNGKEWGLLEPLMVNHGRDIDNKSIVFSGRLDMSYSYARLKAAEESSILPLLPKVNGVWITPELLNSLAMLPDGSSGVGVSGYNRTHLPIDSLKPSGFNGFTGTGGAPASTSQAAILRAKYKAIESLQKESHNLYTKNFIAEHHNNGSPNSMHVLKNIEVPELSSSDSWVFEPLADILYVHRHVGRVKHHETTLIKRIVTAKKLLFVAQKDLELFITTKLEKYPMCYEDYRSKLIRTTEQLEAATARITAVMSFSKRNIESLDLQEKNLVCKYCDCASSTCHLHSRFKNPNSSP